MFDSYGMLSGLPCNNCFRNLVHDIPKPLLPARKSLIEDPTFPKHINQQMYPEYPMYVPRGHILVICDGEKSVPTMEGLKWRLMKASIPKVIGIGGCDNVTGRVVR